MEADSITAHINEFDAIGEQLKGQKLNLDLEM